MVLKHPPDDSARKRGRVWQDGCTFCELINRDVFSYGEVMGPRTDEHKFITLDPLSDQPLMGRGGQDDDSHFQSAVNDTFMCNL